MISIIAPVFNVEKYLVQFIDSILQQTYKEFELLLVDDCGTDGSSEICRKFEQIDNRIRVIRQSCNGGVAKARNRGIVEARGEYIMLADSDDYLAPNALEVSMKLMSETKADITYAGFYMDREGKIEKKKFRHAKRRYSYEEALKTHLNLHTLYGYPWGKLFKREVLEGVKNPEDMSCGEDGVFSYRALSNAKNGVAFTDIPIYYYRIRGGSLSGHGQAFGNRDLDVFKQIEYITACTDEQKYYKEILAFTFALYNGAMCKYLLSDDESKARFANEYNKMKIFSQKNWKKVVVYASNPRIKFLALKYGFRKN